MYYIAVDHCRPPPWVMNAAATLNQTSRSVNITCFTGYRFPDGVSFKVLHCYPDGQWDYIPKCDGKCVTLIVLTVHVNVILQLCIQYMTYIHCVSIKRAHCVFAHNFDMSQSIFIIFDTLGKLQKGCVYQSDLTRFV